MAKLKLIAEFIKNPSVIGTVYPSSPHLAKTITSGIDLEKAHSVLEIGPGTAAFTPFIVKKLGPKAKYLAVELNEAMYDNFRKKFPKLKIYNDCATNLKKILEKEKIESVDAIVSGLPWATFSAELQEGIMDVITGILHDDGAFTTYAYLQGSFMPGARRLKKLLKKHFKKIEVSEVVWRNIPPSFVYRCWKK